MTQTIDRAGKPPGQPDTRARTPRRPYPGHPRRPAARDLVRARETRPSTWSATCGEPGSFPYTRGMHRTMYRGKLWTMRQFAGFGSAEETNERFQYLLAQGQTGLSVAFDLPTLMGYDSDDPHAPRRSRQVRRGRRLAGRHGDALRRHPARRGHHLDDHQLAGGDALGDVPGRRREAGRPTGPSSRGTLQNDILKEYIAQKEYIFPPRPSMRLVTDTFEFCAEQRAAAGTRSRSAATTSAKPAATAAQELAFTLRRRDRVRRVGVERGLDVDEFAPRLSFFFNAHNDFFEEIAKFRAARRIWATVMRDRYGAKDRALAGAALPHARRPGARSPRSSPRTTSSAPRSRRWRRCWAARSRCTPTRWTRRWRCRPRRPRGSRCAPSRSSPTRPASPTRSIRSAARYFVEDADQPDGAGR